MPRLLIAIFVFVTCLTPETLADKTTVTKSVEIGENTPTDILIPLAEKGDSTAQCLLGICYRNGKGIEQDNDLAFMWFSQSAGQGNARGQNGLALCYSDGIGTSKDEAEALKWMRSAVEQKSPIAQFNLACWYQEGSIVSQDDQEAFRLYRLSAEQGHVNAQYKLGCCYSEGYGIKKDDVKAMEWFRKAAKKNHSDAWYAIGVHYHLGRGVEQDYAEAVKWYSKAAEQGDEDAQFQLGCLYADGKGVEKDETKAMEWFRKAAEKNHSGARFAIGVHYQFGRGVEQDYTEAVKWYTKAAEQGHLVARNNLGVCYRDGLGVETDPARAVELFRQAAEEGDAMAQYNLGKAYKDGLHVKKDYEEAEQWLRKAAEQNFEEARKELQKSDPLTLLLAAIVPVLLFLFIIHWADTQKEPLWLLLWCLFLGAVSVVPAFLVESFLSRFDSFDVKIYSLTYQAVMIALTEELLKFLVLYWVIWKHKEFDQYYDGIVYAVFVSLGFALVENIAYVLQHGRETAALRAALAIPLHCCCGVIMGYYFSLARFSTDQEPQSRLFLCISLPVFLHALYDFFIFYFEASKDAVTGSAEESWVIVLEGWFMVLIVYLWCTGVRRIKRLSEKDRDFLEGLQDGEKSRWFRIALHQRSLLQGMIFGFVFIPVSLFLFTGAEKLLSDSTDETRSYIYKFLFGVPYFTYFLWMLQVVCRMSDSLGRSGCFLSIAWVVSSLKFPPFALIFLFWLNKRATESLAEAGYKADFWDVDLKQFSAATKLLPVNEQEDHA